MSTTPVKIVAKDDQLDLSSLQFPLIGGEVWPPILVALASDDS